MKLLDVQKIVRNGKVRLSGLVQINNFSDPIEIYFEYPEQFSNFVNDSADAFVPALLLPSMEKGETLEIKPPMSEKLFQNLETIQDIFHQWYPKTLKKIHVAAAEIKKYAQNSNQQVGSFFSLGVDSFYTFYKNMNSNNSRPYFISHLIYMKGLEHPLYIYNNAQEKEVLSRILEVAAEAGKDCIWGETNIRNHFSLDWGRYYHGAGLASTALSLSGAMDYILIPSTHSYRDVFPWGSSPLVDHLWSTEKMSLVHDGSEVSRAEKVANLLVEDPLSMKYLRVCVRSNGNEKNCGKCFKCVRTMITLQLAGSLEKAKTFPDRLPDDFLERMKIDSDNDLSFAVENLELAQKLNTDPHLTKMLADKVEKAEAEIFCKNKSLLNVQKLIVYLFYLSLVKRPVQRINKSIEQLKERLSYSNMANKREGSAVN